jgi:dipeptidyl aminopeptidase/acylaminoacyl peptidase
MKKLAAAGVLAGALVMSAPVPTQPSSATGLTIDQLIDIRHPSNPMWTPDGKAVVFVWDRAGISSVYVAPADGKAPPRELRDADGSLNGAFWSADGSALMVARSGDLWRVPLDGSSASAVWTTPQNETNITPSPDRTRVAFVRSAVDANAPQSPTASPASGRGGSAAGAGTELWIRSLHDGHEVKVAAQAGMSGISWSPDGQHIVFTSGAGTIRHEQTPTYSGAKIIYTINENLPGQTFVVATSGGTATAIAGGGGFGGRRWIDPRHFVFDRTSPDYKRRTSLVVDINGGEPKPIVEIVEEKFWSMTGDANSGAQPSPDGKWIAFLSDRDGWDHLYVMPAAGGDPVQITKGKFEAWRPQWSPDSQRIAFDANSEGKYGVRQLYVATIGGNPSRARIAQLTTERGTNIAPQWSPDGKRLVYQHTDPHNSADLYAVNVPDPAIANQVYGVTQRLTNSMPASVNHQAFVEPELVHYSGPDGQPVPAYLFVPKNLDRSKKHPTVVWIHGDGVNQNYDGWHVQRNYAVYYSFHQYLLQKGYIVIAPDYRGSIGYGRAWREGVYMDVGGKDAQDAWMVTNYLKTLPYVDMNRIGVWGLSYGGFFTLIAVTDQPKMFRAAVDVAGVVDYAMYYEDPYHGGWTASRIGTPEQNPKVYANASPISKIDRLETPLLVLHGTADVNVPYLHSVRLLDEAMKKNKSHLVEFMTYPGEFHYFTREHVLRDAWRRVDEFFASHLKSSTTATH